MIAQQVRISRRDHRTGREVLLYKAGPGDAIGERSVPITRAGVWVRVRVKVR